MGGCTFMTEGEGETAEKAFDNAVRQAQWESGHGGYTGTIAEKRDFTVIEVPEGTDPEEYAEELMDDDDPRIDDKWGPAGCVKLGDGKWLFFGWASS